MTAAGYAHGIVVSQANGMLWSFVVPQQLGHVLGAETGFRLERNPDHVRAPDVAFVARDRLPPSAQRAGFVDLAPDLVVEVVSPFDSWSAVQEKVADWLAHGVKVVLVADPPSRSVTIWRQDGRIERRAGDEEVDAEPVLPGFRCRARDFFPPDPGESP